MRHDVLNAEERRELPDNEFGLPDKREFPMPDAAHVRAAEAYFRYCPENRKHELAVNILRKANEFGVNIHSQTIIEWAKQQ
ncbi:MAG: DUF6582 domain-containing protein [Bacteroidales bacterium]